MGFFKKLFRFGSKKSKPESQISVKGKADSATDNSNPDIDDAAAAPSRGGFLKGSKRVSKSAAEARKARGPDLSAGSQRPVLSPRNDGITSSTNVGPTLSLPQKETKGTSFPVDLDESVYTATTNSHTPNQQYYSTTQERDENRLVLPSDGLENYGSRSQLQLPTTYDMPVYEAPKTLFSAGHLNMAGSDEMQSDGESSSFNLSTDAEDGEYEALRRRIGMAPANAVVGIRNNISGTTGVSGQNALPSSSKNIYQSSLLDTSDVSSPTYYTDGEGSVFPNLPTDDEATMTESQSSSVKEMQPRSLLGGAPYPDPEDEHDVLRGHRNDQGNRHYVGASKPIESDGWTPHGVVSNIKPEKDVKESFHSSFNSKFMEAVYSTGSNSSTKQTGSPKQSAVSRKDFISPKKDDFVSSSDNFGFNDDAFADFADFSAFDPKFDDFNPPLSKEMSQQQPTIDRDTGNSSPSQKSTKSRSGSNGPSSPVQKETSLSELLAQAKSSKSNLSGARRSGESVNSTPLYTSAAYLRQHHNLKPRNSSTVTDIIQSLEAANASRISSTSARNLQSHSRDAHSTGSRDGSNPSLRAAKERVRRRREREERRMSGAASHENDSSEEDLDENNKINESWLMKEVEDTLGPRGIAADMESLSGRSNRSNSSRGNRSHKSHRSHRSHRSRTTGSRRQKQPSTSGGSGDSVDSHGEKSHGSRRSRGSRYSHKSARSYISQMSEQSRSVANDLLRLEMQLKMVSSGATDIADGSAVGSYGADRSVGGSKRGAVARSSSSRNGSTRSRPAASAARRSRITVNAPPGKLGIILVNKADSKGTVVSGVRTSSVLSEKIHPGDRIVAIDGEDVSHMSVSEITTIMARKSEFERTLTVLTTPRHHPYIGGDSIESNGSLGSPRSPGKYSYNH